MSNVAIKLYGLSWSNVEAAHPLEWTPTSGGIFQPWFFFDIPAARAFRVVAYHSPFGGIKSSFDVSVLEAELKMLSNLLVPDEKGNFT